ncbi:MAG: hypothetical protein K2K06_01535, partial [Oscillospiraceae bacterium]|nr:hypothetical protein [Oscillospiraceae bacterium]
MVNEKKDFNNSYDDEDKINNEIRNYLNLHGVHVSNEAIDDLENMCASGYREIPCSYIGQINMIFQQLPGLATHAISHHGTYRVYFDKGLGVLQQAKQGNGFLRANIVRAGTNNDITGQALLKAASKGPLIANSVFFALSMVTGQYFLTEINNKLSQIDSIQQFYENEKQSKLFANYHDLQQVIQTFEFMNTNQKLATIQRLQQIRHDSYADLISYSNTFEKQKVELTGLKINTKKNIQKTSDIINKIGKIILSYKFALYT